MVKFASRRVSYKMILYSILLLTFTIRFVFVLIAMGRIEEENDCTSIGCTRQKLGPKIRGKEYELMSTLDDIYQILEDEEPPQKRLPTYEAPHTLREFLIEMKNNHSDATSFALMLKSMILKIEQRTRSAKIQEYVYRHVASICVPRPVHCLALRLAAEHSTSALARRPLPPPDRAPALADPSLHHFVLASDNVLAAGAVAASLASASLHPSSVVLHVVTDRKTRAAMHAWFALRPPGPVVVEVRGVHEFDWFARGRVPVIEAVERDREARSRSRGGGSPAAVAAKGAGDPVVVAAELQALSPKYHSLLNHIRIHLPELFPALKKVVFLDDDVVVQSDLSPLWDIDLNGKVNGAVQTCRGDDKLVMSKRLKSYLNFSHHRISQNFDPEECAWAYGMNIFDLEAWRKTNISLVYHHWLRKNLESDLRIWKLGTLPPGLIAFHGHVHIIDSCWHMLGLGYQENTSVKEALKAAVVHFNGRAKPWSDIAFPHLRPLWTKHIDFSDRFVKACNVRA